MTESKMSLVKALQTFLKEDPHGRKMTIPEFQDLTRQDKVELREMLIAEGYDVAELPAEKITSE